MTFECYDDLFENRENTIRRYYFDQFFGVVEKIETNIKCFFYRFMGTKMQFFSTGEPL